MCTGDNIDTAIAISKNAGIVTEEECEGTVDDGNYSCMTGKEFRELVGGLFTNEDGKEMPKNMNKFKKIK
jgi:magnesium-transporting ATPase (P-type)